MLGPPPVQTGLLQHGAIRVGSLAPAPLPAPTFKYRLCNRPARALLQDITRPSILNIGDVAVPHWWRGHRLQPIICCVPGRPDGWRRVMATATMTFIPNVDVIISYERVTSHQSSHHRLCPVTRLEQVSYKVHNC